MPLYFGGAHFFLVHSNFRLIFFRNSAQVFMYRMMYNKTLAITHSSIDVVSFSSYTPLYFLLSFGGIYCYLRSQQAFHKIFQFFFVQTALIFANCCSISFFGQYQYFFCSIPVVYVEEEREREREEERKRGRDKERKTESKREQERNRKRKSTIEGDRVKGRVRTSNKTQLFELVTSTLSAVIWQHNVVFAQSSVRRRNAAEGEIHLVISICSEKVDTKM